MKMMIDIFQEDGSNPYAKVPPPGVYRSDGTFIYCLKGGYLAGLFIFVRYIGKIILGFSGLYFFDILFRNGKFS
ncbi:hypothetical protein SAMN05216540_10154 [Butyrivibrio sp. M55]|nr:hypothetical protein SAMN05216540_10154 [Butyrivibrio sp. M55]